MNKRLLINMLLPAFLILGCQQSKLVEETQPEAQPEQEKPVLSFADSLYQKAISLSENGEFDKAMALFRRLEEWSLEQQNWPTYAEAHLQQSFIYNLNKQPDSSLILANEVVKIGNQHLTPQDSIFAKVYFHKAEIFLRLGQRDSSIHYYELAKPINELAGFWESQTFANIGLAVNHFYEGDYAKMKTDLNNAFSVAKVNLPPEHITFPIIFQLQGVLYDILGDYDQAILVTNRALEINLAKEKKVENDSFAIATNYNNLGAFYYSRGDYDQAIDYYERSKALREQLGDPVETAFSISNLALAFAAKGLQEKSLKLLGISDQVFSEVISTRGLDIRANTYNFIARNALANGNAGQALSYAQKALSLLADNAINRFASLQHIGNAYLQLGKYGLALDTLQLATASFSAIYGVNHPGLADRYRMIAEVYNEIGQHDMALQYCQKALKLLDETLDETNIYVNPDPGAGKGHLLELIQILPTKANSLYALYKKGEGQEKDLEFVYQTYQLTTDLIDRLREAHLATGSKQFLIKQSKAIYEKGIALALQLNEKVPDSSYLDQAFVLAEKSKAILLAERLQDSEAKTTAEIPDSLLQTEAGYKRDLAFYQKKLYDENQKEKPDSLKKTVWEEKVFNLKRSLEKHNEYLETNYPEYYALKNKSKNISVAAIQQRLLDENELLLEYFVGDSSIYMFEISRKALAVHAIAKPNNFTQQVMDFRNLVIYPESGNHKEAFSQFSEAAHTLGKNLLAPILSADTYPDRIFIIPDEVLHFIPFDLLPTKAPTAGSNFTNAAYLIRESSLNYSYSAGLLLQNEGQPVSQNRNLRCLAFAPSYEDEGPIALSGRISRLRGSNVALPGAQREVKALAQHFRGDFYFGDEASETAFKEQAPDYQLIHLAMHGAAEASDPMYSKLYFTRDTIPTDDDTLFAYEIYNMQLNADLIVLSACETGHGKFVEGEGVMSLASAFIHAGIPSVTMSLWEAQDEATAMLMEKYYRNLANGQEKDEALRQAKLDYLSKSNAQKHPFYWAAFVNIGDPEALATGGSLGIWKLWALLGFGLIAWIFYIRRRARS